MESLKNNYKQDNIKQFTENKANSLRNKIHPKFNVFVPFDQFLTNQDYVYRCSKNGFKPVLTTVLGFNAVKICTIYPFSLINWSDHYKKAKNLNMLYM